MPTKTPGRVLPGKVVAARLTPREAAAFGKLLEDEQQKAKVAGSADAISGSALIRRLVRKEARARGLWPGRAED